MPIKWNHAQRGTHFLWGCVKNLEYIWDIFEYCESDDTDIWRNRSHRNLTWFLVHWTEPNGTTTPCAIYSPINLVLVPFRTFAIIVPHTNSSNIPNKTCKKLTFSQCYVMVDGLVCSTFMSRMKRIWWPKWPTEYGNRDIKILYDFRFVYFAVWIFNFRAIICHRTSWYRLQLCVHFYTPCPCISTHLHQTYSAVAYRLLAEENRIGFTCQSPIVHQKIDLDDNFMFASNYAEFVFIGIKRSLHFTWHMWSVAFPVENHYHFDWNVLSTPVTIPFFTFHMCTELTGSEEENKRETKQSK